MTTVELQFHPYKYFPYERRLAGLEVRSLLHTEPESNNDTLQVHIPPEVDIASLERLTYFRHAALGNGTSIIPQQARLEASATVHKNPNLLRRQQTRYSAHGLHAYRGKFNPQMVRTITNLLSLNKDAKLWDPFCGSGTVLLEAVHQGFDALGVDLNPLAIAIANAKLTAIRADPRELERAALMVIQEVNFRTNGLSAEAPQQQTIDDSCGPNWLERFPCPNYLLQWFPIPVLGQLRIILDTIDAVVPSGIRDVFRIILSDILRDVSWQDPGDLRVRRRKSPSFNYPAAAVFTSALHSRISNILSAQKHVPSCPTRQAAFRGDSGSLNSLDQVALTFLEQGIDCIISSPPYATALPYIDTQRLSLALLGLASVEDLRRLDSSLVGSREILTRDRRVFEDYIDINYAEVAPEVWELCKSLKGAYDPNRDGFRRQNTPAVVYRYFAGMTRIMSIAAKYLNKDGTLAFIIGPNRTSIGGTTFRIDTPQLLAATGRHIGLVEHAMHKLDAYSRYDVHSRNAIREETLLLMRCSP